MNSTTQPLPTWRYWWVLIRHHPGLYLATTGMRILIFAVFFQAWGLITRAFFDALSGNAPWAWGLMRGRLSFCLPLCCAVG